MGEPLENAKRLYLEGIRDGRYREAIERYTGDRYTQHSSGVPDGVEGFIEFFGAFVERNPVREIEIVRGLDDGRYAFLHAYQNLNRGQARWVTMDLFDTDDAGRIVEHWDVIVPFVDETASGRTQIDGPTELSDPGSTGANLELVGGLLADVFERGRYSDLGEYISPGVRQHSPRIADGVHAWRAHLDDLEAQAMPLRYEPAFKLVASGEFVVSYSKAHLGDVAHAVFDLYRVEDGLVAEHWDAWEAIPPRDEWGNSGKF